MAAAAPRPAEIPKEEPLPVDPEVAAVLEKRLLRPGDVTAILKERDQFEVFRLIALTQKSWKVEGVRFPKVDFDARFEKARRVR